VDAETHRRSWLAMPTNDLDIRRSPTFVSVRWLAFTSRQDNLTVFGALGGTGQQHGGVTPCMIDL
jgi:hypothetical protein